MNCYCNSQKWKFFNRLEAFSLISYMSWANTSGIIFLLQLFFQGLAPLWLDPSTVFCCLKQKWVPSEKFHFQHQMCHFINIAPVALLITSYEEYLTEKTWVKERSRWPNLMIFVNEAVLISIIRYTHQFKKSHGFPRSATSIFLL